MKFPPQFLRIAAPAIASLLLIIAVAALRPVCATQVQAESPAERYVVKQLQKGEVADLYERTVSTVTVNKTLRGTFIAALLTNRDARFKIHPHGIQIRGAVITGNLDLESDEIPCDVDIQDCIFQERPNFVRSKFAKTLDLTFSTFKQGASFDGTTIGLDFIAIGGRFYSPSNSVSFQKMHVGRDFDISRSSFDTETTWFDGTRVTGTFLADDSQFNSIISFTEMRVDGSFFVRHCIFSSWADFTGAYFGYASFDDSSFASFQKIDFTRMKADSISFDDVKPVPNSEFILHRMSFKTFSPLNLDKISFLLSRYDREFFTNLEGSLRMHGHPDDADKVFIARKRAERDENCKNFLRQCKRGAWAWSLFEDMLAGYGKSLQNLLFWSLGFLFIGTFVFRSEKGMRTKDGKDAENYEGKYRAFWYSLDLFLPIIKLGEADVWTPRDDRRWANLYRRVHIIIGSLFVPIGLAAWTGIIK
jgi:hypothetical protein